MPVRIAAACVLALALCGGCRRGPRVSDDTYREAVTAFYVALAAMQTSQELHARTELDKLIQLVPDEPAAHANLGLLLLRQQQVDEAVQRLVRASHSQKAAGETSTRRSATGGAPSNSTRRTSRLLSRSRRSSNALAARRTKRKRSGCSNRFRRDRGISPRSSSTHASRRSGPTEPRWLARSTRSRSDPDHGPPTRRSA
jgi:hypothetical protein